LVEGEATIPNANTADIPNIFLKKIRRITMPLDENHLLYIAVEIGDDHSEIIEL
jgi:hypothetical protein